MMKACCQKYLQKFPLDADRELSVLSDGLDVICGCFSVASYEPPI